jgi:hypothetical protein
LEGISPGRVNNKVEDMLLKLAICPFSIILAIELRFEFLEARQKRKPGVSVWPEWRATDARIEVGVEVTEIDLI